MANNFDSNYSQKLMRVFMEKFENARVLSKNVNTQLLDGKFNPSSGTTVKFKRPTDYTSTETATGDVSAVTAKDIIVGSGVGTVQNYITVHMNFNEVDQALKMDQLDQLLAPAATRIVTTLELNFGAFMAKNAGLFAGTIGTAADAWSDVAYAGAMMESHGIPMDSPWYYACNPFTQVALADATRGLAAGGSAGKLISDAYKKAVIGENYAGFDAVMKATTLPSYTTFNGADRVGAIASNPDVTYVTAKDTMTQDIAVSGFQANLEVKAGEILQITGRNRLNLSTRQTMYTETGASVVFTGTVNSDVTLSGTGTGTITITGPAIYEATGAFNTVDSAPVAGDVVTLLGASNTAYQPNMFWHKNAFSIGSVPIEKLYSTDTLAETEDGLMIRCSKYADGDKNQQKVRFDIHPAFAALNPFFAGHGWGR